MSLNKIGLIAYIVFLLAYAAYKYSVAVPPNFSAAYAQSVGILVVLTAILPFVATWLLLRVARLSHPRHTLVALLAGAVFCMSGYAMFWQLFISASEQAPSMMSVALRGFGWGLAQGAIAAMVAR